jgi:hypothetical protein
MKNPFFYDETEIYNSDDIFRMFVEDKTILSNLYKPKHNFICGDRGTGKSMYLRYLEPACQFKLHNGWENFINQDDSFIAFYFCVPKNILNIKEFQSRNIPANESLYAHFFNMLITENIMLTIKKQLNEIPINQNVYENFVDEFIKLMNPLNENVEKIDNLFSKENDPFNWILYFVRDEKTRITDFVKYYNFRDIKYYGSLTDYHDYILPIVRLIKKLFDFKNSIYFLIDDAGNVFDFQQKVFNSWISNRNHNDISIKISTVPMLYKTFLTIDGNFIDGKNDFTYIYLDNYGSKSQSLLETELLEILNRRLYNSTIEYSINNFFPEDKSQKMDIEKARKDIEAIALKNNISDKVRFINRYTMQKFYQNKSEGRNLKERTSIDRTYAGINDIINFSSHNIRDCLKICSNIFDKKYADIADYKTIKPIDAQVQNQIIKEISKNEVVGITLYKEQYSASSINYLKQLIDSLGNLYRSNLLDFDYREYGVTAFQTDMINLTEQQKEIIRIAVENRYFLRKFYSERDGKTINPAYAINKMLFPYYKLELAPFSGRIKISSSEFELALTNSDEFINTVSRKYKKLHKQNEYEQLDLFDIIDEKEDGIDDLKNNLSEIF